MPPRSKALLRGSCQWPTCYQSNGFHKAWPTCREAGGDARRMRKMQICSEPISFLDPEVQFRIMFAFELQATFEELFGPTGSFASVVQTCFLLNTVGDDDEGLRGFSECGPTATLGTYNPDENLNIKAPGAGSVQLKMRFHRFPLVTPKLDTPSKMSFSVETLDFKLMFFCFTVCFQFPSIPNTLHAVAKDWRRHVWLWRTWAKTKSSEHTGAPAAGWSLEAFHVSECSPGSSVDCSSSILQCWC